MLIHSAVITGSVQFNNTDVSGITNVSSFATTASVDALVVRTGSFATTSSVNELQSKTGSYATTSSVNELQSKTGSYTSTSSFGAYSSSINTFTSSATTRLNTIESVTGSFASTSSVNNLQSVTGSYATTGSNQFNGNQSISGSITSNGTITAQTLVVQTVTSSIEFVTGSTKNGSLAANTHQFTGSILITGSLNVNKGVITLPDSIHTSAQINFKNVATESELMKFPASNYTMTLYGATDKIYWKTDKSISNQTILSLGTNGNVGIGTTSTGSFVEIYSTDSYGGGAGTLKINSNTNGQTVLNMSNQSIPKSYEIAVGGTTNTTPGAWYVYDNTAGAQRITLTSTGNVLIGSATAAVDRAKLGVTGSASSSVPVFWIEQGGNAPYAFLSGCDSYHGIVFRGYPTVSGDYSVTAGDYMSFIEYGGQFIFYKKQPGLLTQQVRFTDGVIYATNTTVQSISDVRTKENIRNSEQGLDIIEALRPVRFDFKEEFNEGRKNQLGFIAQEVEEIFPDAVSEWKNDNDGINYKTVGPAALIPVLVKAIQELKAEIDILKQQ
jgi:hypothetical protein